MNTGLASVSRRRPETDIEWKEGARLDGLNSMGLRAAARLMAVVRTEQALSDFLEWAAEEGEDFVVLGEGTNVIFAKESLDLVVLRLAGDFEDFAVDATGITAGAAARLAALVKAARESGLSGLENAWGIPGLLGGALAGNAGTRDWAIGDCVEWVEVFDRSGVKKRLARDEAGFAYRRSALAGRVVTRSRLALRKEARERIEEAIARAAARRSGQPKGVGSSGCIFRNPPGDSAGRLIDAAGLKGLRCGGAMVSPVHANFIVNAGGATGADVLRLIETIRGRVREKFGVELETEVRVIPSKG